MALHTELPIYRTGVRLLSLAVKVQEQMPRSIKRILGDKVTQHCVDMLDLMAPCPACSSYNMKPQMPIQMALTGSETMPQLLGKWARSTKAGATPLEGPAYYMCWDCGHKGPAVDCTGRTSEDARQDRALNDQMKRLWNTQTPTSLEPGP